MKRGEIVLTGFADAVPVACGMIATVCAMPTAFRIAFYPALIVGFCVIAALLLSFWMHVPRYGFGFGALYFTLVILLFVFCYRQVKEGAVTLFYKVMDTLPGSISRMIDMDKLAARAAAYADPKTAVSLALIMIAAALGFLLAFSLIRGKMVLLSMLIPLPLILLGLYYTNQPPALWTMVLLTVYCGYALLGNALRKSDEPGRGRFFALLAPLLPAFFLLILALFPKSDFQPIAPETRQKFFSEQFGEVGDSFLTVFGRSSPKEIDLNDIDDRDRGTNEVFKVWASRTGAYLLRTHSYGAYENGKWTEADAYDGEWRSMAALGLRQPSASSRLMIADSVSGERIVPYAFLSGDMIVGESRVRASGRTAYTISFTRDYSTKAQEVTQEESLYYEFALRQYTMADGPEKEALLKIAGNAGIVKSQNALETARRVAAFVQSAGTYTLSPGKTPEGKDFVLYFLTKGRQGYCVHFASAATAILQALGIPARYTTGYYVVLDEVASGEWHSVPESAEHAWAEVYVLGVGWVPIESTPGFFSPEGETGNPGGTTPVPKTPVPSTPVPSTPVPTTPVPTTPAPQTQKPNEPEETLVPTKTPQSTEKPGGTPSPSNTPNGPEDGSEKNGAWWLLLLLPAVPGAWIGIGALRRRHRETLFRNKDCKKSIPEMAYYLHRLERYGLETDLWRDRRKAADQWALEAVFSDHEMKKEHRELLKRVHEAQREVYQASPIRRFVLRWILFRI